VPKIPPSRPTSTTGGARTSIALRLAASTSLVLILSVCVGLITGSVFLGLTFAGASCLIGGMWLARRAFNQMADEVALARRGYREITAQHMAELQAREARKGAMFEAALDCIVTIDHDGRVREWNPAAERTFGYSREKALGETLATLIIPLSLREAHRQGMAHYLASGHGPILGRRIETTAARADGSELPVELSIVRIEYDGPPMFTGYIRDISERKEAEAALRRSEEQLRQSQKMEAVGSLAGGIAHDFNNLLTVIGGYSKLLLDRTEKSGEPAREVEEINKAANRAALLTRQLLAFSRRQVLQPRLIDVNGIVMEMEDMLRRLIGASVLLRTTLSPDAGAVLADAGQMEQVLMNLVVNARDAMPDGGELEISTAHMRLDGVAELQGATLAAGDYTVIKVRDRGCGMDAETLSRIFEPFFTTKEVGKGTGLGLSMAYGIVKQSNGEIVVESILGQGSTFTVFLPQASQSGSTSSVETREASPARAAGETILLVEDDPLVRNFLNSVLQPEGYRILVARGGEEALRLAAEHEGTIHLVITDVVMPGMGGGDLVARLIRDRQDLRVLYISGYIDDELVRNGVAVADASFLQKPFAPAELIREARRILDSTPRPERRGEKSAST
jgi:two-component system cell cycle sensor histidine kinase/response regulator CckA